MDIRQKRIVINWMLNQIEAFDMASEKAIIGSFSLDQCWAVGDEIICYGESCGKQTVDVLAEALGVTPVIKGNYKNVTFLGKVFSQLIKVREDSDEKQAE